jgi:DNA-directed RNA polymerase specialized sigma24 family protein
MKFSRTFRVELTAAECAKKMLESRSPRDRTFLIRYYGDGQATATICQDLEISESEADDIRARARESFKLLRQRGRSEKTKG